MHGATLQALVPGTKQGTRQLTERASIAGVKRGCSLGITALGRLQERCERWGRRAVEGYREWERNWGRETGTVTSVIKAKEPESIFSVIYK